MVEQRRQEENTESGSAGQAQGRCAKRQSAGRPRKEPVAGSLDHAVPDAAVRSHRDRALRAGFRSGLCRQPQGDRGHCRQRGGADVRQHHRCAGALWRRARPRLRRVLQPRRHRHQRGDPGHRAGAGAALRQARHAHLPGRDAVRARRRPVQEAQEAAPERGAGSACWSAIIAPSSSPAPGSSQRPRSGWRRSPRACRCSARTSARTCWPTSRPSCWCWRARPTLPGCRRRCGKRQRRRRASAVIRASTPSRCRAPASSRSCSIRPGAICARRRSTPGSCAAPTAARPTTARSWPRS